MRITSERISADAYRPYGDVLSADREELELRPANQGTAGRRNFQMELTSDRPNARPNFASFRCAPRTDFPMQLLLLEKHPHSTQVFIPMNAERYLVVVALGGAAPDWTTLRAFVAHRGEAISYRPGVWHHPMIALDSVTDFACLVWEDGSAGDAVEWDARELDAWLERP